MASNINANNIDGTYPVAGVDNDSQGFRTNFTNIKNNFTFTKAEIEDLQSKALLKEALTGTTLDNNLNGTIFSSAAIRDFREIEVDLGTASGSITLDHSAAHVYTINTSGSISLAFTNFPAAGRLGRIKLKIVLTSVAHTITLPAAVSLGTSSIQGLSSNVITFAQTGTYYLEFTTDDQGTTIHIEDLTRARNRITDTTSSNNTTTGAFVVSGGVGIGANLNVGGDLSVSGNIAIQGTYSIADLTATGNATISGLATINNSAVINGNLSSTGIITTGYSYLLASNGFNVSVNTASQLIIDSNQILSSGTVYFPVSPADGQRFGISSNNAVSSLTLNANTGTIIGRVSTLTANSVVNYQYVSSATKWFRV